MISKPDETSTSRSDSDGPQTTLFLLKAILRDPQKALESMQKPGNWRLLFSGLLFSCLGIAAYGAGAGFFQGGDQVLVSAWKAPLVVLASLLLCIPSLFVFLTLAGEELSGRKFVAAIVGSVSLVSLLFVALLPISWLFSVSSRSLSFMVILHLAIWMVVVGLAVRPLRLVAPKAGRAVSLWMLLFLAVSLQVATQLRPLLWRATDAPLFEAKKLSAMGHFAEVVRHDQKVTRQERELDKSNR